MATMTEAEGQGPLDHETTRVFKEARARQLKMLPATPNIDGLQLAVLFQPCEIVSSDFYDFLELKNDRLAIVQGEIGGHGMANWGDMMVILRTLRIHAKLAPTPRDTLVAANQDLMEELTGKTIATVFYAVLDRNSLELTFARAGHPPMILFNRERSPELQLVQPRGRAIAALRSAALTADAIENASLQLQQGDLAIWTTAGIGRLYSATDETRGIEALSDLVREHGSLDPAALVEKIKDDIRARHGEGLDGQDLTVTAMKIG